jgi:FlaA1/EpsC-like NDP-sugar epimerase
VLDASPRSAVDVNRVLSAARRRLPVVHFAADSVLWVVSIPLAVWLRYDYRFSQLDHNEIVPVVLAVVLQGVFGVLTGLYRRRWRYGSFDEVRVVALTAASVGVVLTVGLWQWNGVPRSVPILATGLSLVGQITARSLWRLRNESRNRPSGEHLQRLVVVGAGEGGDQVLRTLRGSADSSYLPVALLDDDPDKRNLRLSGVRVEGRVDDLETVAKKYHVGAVLVAVPSADSSLIRRVSALAAELHLRVLVLPPVDQLLGGLEHPTFAR